MSGIAVDPADPNHAWISYSGYGAYTPGEPGHVFEARFDPATGTASFTDRSYDIGDQPVTGIALFGATGDVYAATDFGVLRLPAGATHWETGRLRAADGGGLRADAVAVGERALRGDARSWRLEADAAVAALQMDGAAPASSRGGTSSA